jgi:hypothetical protein
MGRERSSRLERQRDGETATIPKEKYMKRRLIMGIYLGLAALAACQAEPSGETDSVSQEVSTPCDAKMPPTPFWDGQRLEPTKEGQIYLYYQDADRPGEWVLVLVDYANATIPFGTRTKTGSAGTLLSKLDEAAQFAGGRQPSPPQPVRDWSLAAALIEWGKRAAPDKAGAEQGGVCKAQ